MESYSDVRSDLKTGDLVLFSGATFFSSVIKWVIGGKWSHVGVVVRSRHFPGRVLLWEATTLADLADVETGRAASGVQLVYLSDRLARYAGEFKLRAPRQRRRYVQSVAGGCLMGYGAGIAIGCTLGAFFSAIPSLALSGWIFGIALLAGAGLGTRIIRRIA